MTSYQSDNGENLSPTKLYENCIGPVQEDLEAVAVPATLQPADHVSYTKLEAKETLRAENGKHSAIGVTYQSLNVYGFGTATDYQKTFANSPLAFLSLLGRLQGLAKKSRIDILRDLEGLVSSGEMLLVLGRPGSGCRPFLKTLAGHTHGLIVDPSSDINYQGKATSGPPRICLYSFQLYKGIPPNIMHYRYRGTCTCKTLFHQARI